MENASGRITLLIIAFFSLSSFSSRGYQAQDFTLNKSRMSERQLARQASYTPSTGSEGSTIKRNEPDEVMETVAEKRADRVDYVAASESRQVMIDKAMEFVGTPYKYGGKSPSGFDCSGFTQYVYKSQGLTLPPNSKSQASAGKKLSPTRAEPGDLLIFEDRGRIHHVGMVLEAGPGSVIMIHASSSQGVIVEDVFESSYWKKRLSYAVKVL